jgi:hypothetical protein
MKTVIYYFTGTGNTLAVARDLAAELGETTLVPLRRAMQAGVVTPDADTVGIAFPVHYLDMPAIVREFVCRLRFGGDPRVFGIATCGERPGGALFSLDRVLRERGSHLWAGYVFVMPENFNGPVDLMEPEATLHARSGRDGRPCPRGPTRPSSGTAPRLSGCS